MLTNTFENFDRMTKEIVINLGIGTAIPIS